MTEQQINLSGEECRALYGLIDQLTGGNPENAFAWDGTDDPADPLTRALARVYAAAGERVPDGLLPPETSP